MAEINRIIRKLLSRNLVEKLDYIRESAAVGVDSDEFGFDADYLEAALPAMLFAYNLWFRVETHGSENIPADGPVLIVGNHSGQVPVDGVVISTAMIVEMEPPRLVRSMVDYWVPTLPFVNILFTRMGQTVGVWENARRLLENDQALLVFPEGTRGLGKTWDRRYQLQHFTAGFMELAIMFGAKIVPVAVIGGEEQMPSLFDARPLAKLFRAPYFPITPTFPLFGLKGAIPYPVKYQLHFGEPMDFSAFKDDLSDPGKIETHVESVKNTLQELINEKVASHPLTSLFSLPQGRKATE